MPQNEDADLKTFLDDAGELVDRQLYHVPIGALIPDPDQPRKHIDEAALKELRASIVKHGVLQPVIFRKTEEGSLVLVSGERRYWASQLAEKADIPAIYNAGGNATEIALVENLQRENLSPIETAEGLQRLKEEGGYTSGQLCAVIGKAESTICEILSLNRLPEAVKSECRTDPTVPRRALVEIAKGKDEEAMTKLFAKYRKQALKSDDLRKATRKDGSVTDHWLQKIDGFAAKLDKLNLAELEDDAEAVKKKLKELMTTIKKRLA